TSNRRTVLARKTLDLEAGSRLAGIFGAERLRINSLHHQAISELGRELEVVGRDLDKIVQAVEDRAHPFLFGVQWHPEYLPYHAVQRRLFAALVDAARE
ncbi:MAG: gamma-glutamyl-gamma-aminobutyrate hydrolase family protein, partial [Candidatus Competibacterales bacterium]|nr:gamma-glutamyl-gamma-aminobutyrate hydrolase family protein [Candidatus Competibacterales bacterium]